MSTSKWSLDKRGGGGGTQNNSSCTEDSLSQFSLLESSRTTARRVATETQATEGQTYPDYMICYVSIWTDAYLMLRLLLLVMMVVVVLCCERVKGWQCQGPGTKVNTHPLTQGEYLHGAGTASNIRMHTGTAHGRGTAPGPWFE